MKADDSVAHVVTAAWCEALEVTEADLGDRFFDAGGHSFAAVRLISSVESRLGVEVPLEDLFAGTLGELIEECEQRAVRVRENR
jgi:acyl carrier protein